MLSAATNIDGLLPGGGRDFGPAAMLEPETLLPSQHYDPSTRLWFVEGERRLMLAVLEDAIFCFMKHAGARRAGARKLFADASRWIMQPQPYWLYSFESICATLGIDMDGLRTRLERWLAERSSSGDPAHPRVRRARWRVGRARRVRPPRVRNRTPRGRRATRPRVQRPADAPLSASA